jgi:hypothetical protein
MTTQNEDSAREESRKPKLVSVPTLKSAVAHRVRYDKPRRFFKQGKEYFESDVIEIDVETDADFAVAGTGPALFVGKIPLLDSERLGERRYRFFAPGSLSLRENASIALGKGGSGVPVPEKKSRVRFRWDPASSR